jgi:hypothetical protein
MKQSPLALAPDGEGTPDPTRDETREAETDPTWVRLGGDALWAGVLPDDALASLPSVDESDAVPPQPPSNPDPALPAGDDPLAFAASRRQEPGSPEFRILCGATAPADIRRRFGWKTDVELAEAYELALQERQGLDGSGDSELRAYWDALVDTAVSEAANRPSYGELNEWEEEEDPREQRRNAKRLDALSKARDERLRSTRSS